MLLILLVLLMNMAMTMIEGEGLEKGRWGYAMTMSL
jgi:hypothetical protein